MSTDVRLPLSSAGRHWLARGAMLAAFLMIGAAWAAESLPAGSRVESVLDGGFIASQRVTVQRILTDASPEALRVALMPDPSPNATAREADRSGPWQVLSAREEAGWRTLQWRTLPDGRTEALLSRWHGSAGSRDAVFDPRIALPPGAQVLRQVSSVDNGRRAETLVAWSRDPVTRIGAFAHQRLLASGFQAGPARGSPDRGIARFYRGRGYEIALTLTSHAGRSGLVLHCSEVSP